MEINLNGEEVNEAIIDYINKELKTKVAGIDYPIFEVGKKNYEVNLDTTIRVYVYRVNDE